MSTAGSARSPLMAPMPAMVFTDLDATLLDHHDYSFDAAAPALRALRKLHIPLILNTSKTLAEAAAINRTLDNPQAVIVENGGALCLPRDGRHPFTISAGEQIADHRVMRFAPSYPSLRQFIQAHRSRHGWALRGFGDMTTEEVAERTGLDITGAHLARQRLCSEPFVWQGAAEDLAAFREQAQAAGLQVRRGGRFWHLTGRTSKAQAMPIVCGLLTADRTPAVPVIALGDSENDVEMLEAADIAVIIRHRDGTHIDCHGRRRTLLSELPGPLGWNNAVLQILAGLGIRGPAN